MDLVRQAIILNWGVYSFFKYQLDNTMPQLRPVLEAGSVVGSVPVQAAIVASTVVLLLVSGKFRTAVAVVAMSTLAWGLAEGLPLLLPSQRPPADPANHLAAGEAFRSFPAAPVLLAFLTLLNLALAMEAWRSGTRWRILFHVLAVGAALWVTMSQLFLGLHFLTDVLAGMTAGVALALLCRGLSSRRFEPVEGDGTARTS